MAENLNAISASAGRIPTQAAPRATVVPIAGLQSSVKLLDLAPGLYAVIIGPAPVPQVTLGVITLPATLVTALGNDPEQRAEIFSTERGADWVGPLGGTVILRIPEKGGQSLITTFRAEQQEAVPLAIQIAAIGVAAGAATPKPLRNNGAPTAPAAAAEPTLPAQITFCIDRVNEQAVAGSWAGAPGSKRFIEAFGISPQGDIEPNGIEYQGFGPNARKTPWVSAGKLCGSRGKNVALTGFAIRPAAHVREKIDIVYEGAFAKSGKSMICRNGEPCRGTHADDPLEALSLSIVSRARP